MADGKRCNEETTTEQQNNNPNSAPTTTPQRQQHPNNNGTHKEGLREFGVGQTGGELKALVGDGLVRPFVPREQHSHLEGGHLQVKAPHLVGEGNLGSGGGGGGCSSGCSGSGGRCSGS